MATIRSALADAVRRLREAKVEDERLVAELLLGHVLRLDRGRLLALPDRPLTGDERERLERLLRRAVDHEPVAYILGRREFFGLDFLVDPRVLIPRPETELLVEEALAWIKAYHGRQGEWPVVADIGTGSGAIAVSLAASLPEVKVFAVDASADALVVAEENARRHRVLERVALLRGDLLAPLPQPVDLVVANLPYISDEEMLNLPPNIARYEPRAALAGGSDGLDWYRALVAQAPAKLRPGGALLLEIGASQGESAPALAAALPGAKVTVLPDLAGLPRVLRIETAPPIAEE